MVDAIWDDGEWISWDTINGQIHAHELREQYPHADLELLQLFEDLVDNAEIPFSKFNQFLKYDFILFWMPISAPALPLLFHSCV